MLDKPLSSDNTDPQLLLESGPMMLRDFNPKGVLRFRGRKCVTCDNEIMDHWLRNDGSLNYFCTQDGPQTSDGITDCVWDVPDEVLYSASEQRDKDISDNTTKS